MDRDSDDWRRETVPCRVHKRFGGARGHVHLEFVFNLGVARLLEWVPPNSLGAVKLTTGWM